LSDTVEFSFTVFFGCKVFMCLQNCTKYTKGKSQYGKN
jgi:hypothetical protein